MDALFAALSRAVVTRELDLSKLSDEYRDEAGEPLMLPFRANLTRGQKKERWALLRELREIRKALGEDGADIDTLNERAQANARAHRVWWANVLMMEPEQVEALQDALPDAHWEWVTYHIREMASEYEVEETKKALGGPSPTSEAPGADRPNSTSEPTSPAT